MKKGIIIFSAAIITLSLMAFSIINLNNSETNQLEKLDSKGVAINTSVIEKNEKEIITDFNFNVGPRFEPIKKDYLQKARTINDFYNLEEAQSIVTLKSVNIVIVENERQTDVREIGYSVALTEAQLKLLQATDYSSGFFIRTEFKKMNQETGVLEDSFLSPHLSVVPEKQAKYSESKTELKEYFKEHSKDVRINIQPEKLRPTFIYFTITKEGSIEDVRLERTSNYPEIDKKMIELINKLPGTWKPAEDSKGNKVNQELVVSFSVKGMGC